jgi:hypothetical protein
MGTGFFFFILVEIDNTFRLTLDYLGQGITLDNEGRLNHPCNLVLSIECRGSLRYSLLMMDVYVGEERQPSDVKQHVADEVTINKSGHEIVVCLEALILSSIS